MSRRHGDFALVGVAATLTVDDAGVCARCVLALTGVGPTPIVPREAAAAMVGVTPTADAIAEVGRRVSAMVRPESDLHASSDYRTHLAGVLTERALARCAERIHGAPQDHGRP